MPCLDWFNGRAGQIPNTGTKLKRLPSRREYYAEALLPDLAVDVFGGRIFAVDSLIRDWSLRRCNRELWVAFIMEV